MELPPSIRFDDTTTLFKTLANRLDEEDFFVFTGVSPSQFADIDDKRDQFRRMKLAYQPSKESGLLFITITGGGAYQSFIGTFALCLHKDMGRIGVDTQWAPRMATTFTSRNGISKQGDFSGNPKPSKREWPTLVVEIGRCQSIQSLRSVMRLWFHESQHEVKIVVLVKLDRDDHGILIERYTEEMVHVQRPGATTTRSTPRGLAPTLRQTIWIRQVAGSPPGYKVTGAPLLLEFRLLFLRYPNTAAGERDIIIGEAELEDQAREAWETDE